MTTSSAPPAQRAGSGLAGRVAVVTGAAHGIGRVYAQRLAERGAMVAVADLDGAAAHSAAQAIESGGGRAIATRTDVTSEQDVAAMSAATLEAFGRIDILVNNAAVFATVPMSRAPFDQISVPEWDLMMNVNLKGVWLACRGVVPAMREQGYGKIINITSDTALKGSGLRIHYVTTKAGLIGFTRTLASELGEAGIRVNAVGPGSTLSEENPAGHIVARKEQVAKSQVIAGVLTPDDIAGAVVFLASPESDAITGQTIFVNAGAYMH